MAVYFLIFIFLLLIVLLILKKLFWVSRVPTLKNKHILVTGGSSGIGKATAVEAAKLGAHITIIARDKSKLEAAIDEIESAADCTTKQIIQYFILDVTKGQDAVDEIVEEAESSAGPIFLLVNCAGMAVCGEFDKAAESDFRHMMDLNYFGTVFPTVCVAKKMKIRREGHIVITGSQASLLGIYGMSAYCASKFALRGFAESLHMELKPYNVSVTVCLPPDTNTPGFANEEKSKPEVTRLISETAGLFEPDVIARQLLSDAVVSVGRREKMVKASVALNADVCVFQGKKFFSVVGLEALILSTLCAGMSPISSLTDISLQISLMSLLRIVSCGYLFHFQKIISDHVGRESTGKSSKKVE